MRLDKYLKVSRLIKRRTVANEVADAGRILVNGKVAKASLASPRSRSRAVTLSSAPTRLRMPRDVSIAALSGSQRITRRTPVTVSLLRPSRIRS